MLSVPKLILRLSAATLAALTSACTNLSLFIANVPASFGDYTRTPNVSYGRDKHQRLDVYLPKQQGTNRPVVIFWYGGSFTSGSRSEYRFVGAALAEHGFIAMLPDYRLYPEVKFPTFVDDAARAVAWAQQHAPEYGGDPRHVVLMGHSAGAYIAAYVALNREFLRQSGAKPEWVAGLVGLSGPYALAPNTRTLHRIFSAPYTPADWQPLRFVSREAPPTFLAHGLDDYLVSPRQTEVLRDALRANDVRVETELYADSGHGATVAGFSSIAPGRPPSLDQVTRFIESVTGPTVVVSEPKPASAAPVTATN